MFEITYHGGNNVIITTKKDQLFVDPNQSFNGLKSYSTKNGVQIATEKRFLVDEESDRPALEGPGEYEAGPFAIIGFETAHHVDNDGSVKAACYRIAIRDVAVGIIGNIQPDLSEDQLELLGLVDVLVIPVGGGGYTLDGREAANLVRKIEPRAVIPVHYLDKNINYEVPQDSIDEFIGEVGATVEQVSKYKIKTANDLPPALTVYQLERT